jgi:hypothetical protein
MQSLFTQELNQPFGCDSIIFTISPMFEIIPQGYM